MPLLPNPRHEVFAQHLAEGFSQNHAYCMARYAPNTANASRLARSCAIAARVQELMALQMMTRAGLVAGITNAMHQIVGSIDANSGADQIKVAATMLISIAHIHGLMPKTKPNFMR